MMHRTSTNVFGSQMLTRTPTATQNKAKPATLFINHISLHRLLIQAYEQIHVFMRGKRDISESMIRQEYHSDPLPSFYLLILL